MKRGVIGALLVLAAVAAAGLAAVVDGVILPSGSNTLKSLHIKDHPALGIYESSDGSMYIGGASGGLTFSSSGVSLSDFTFTGALTGDGLVINDNGIYPTTDDTGKALGASILHWSTLYLARAIQGAHTKAFTDETALDIALVSISSGGAALGTLIYGAVATTSAEATSGRATFACNNLSDTEACSIEVVEETPIDSVGSITCTPTIDADETNAVMFVLTCNEEAGDNGGVAYWRFDMLTTNTISPQ